MDELQIQNNHRNKPANHRQARVTEQNETDLALLLSTDLHVGTTSISLRKKPAEVMRFCYEIDGQRYIRNYLSPLSWRAVLLFALTENKTVAIHDMGRPGLYKSLFPKTLLARLSWHARSEANFPPVARFYDPQGKTVVLLTRSRLCGHGVDALHNLTDTGPTFQPLWVSDIMALAPVMGINLARDTTFTPSMPIGAYIEAAAITGRIVNEQELSQMTLTGHAWRLPVPQVSRTVRRHFELRCKDSLKSGMPGDGSIYDDYKLQSRTRDQP